MLLKHYESILDGTIVPPVGHKNWDLVMSNAKANAEAMKQKIARKLAHPKYAHLKKTTPPKETKKDG